jgi:hypothetical protein
LIGIKDAIPKVLDVIGEKLLRDKIKAGYQDSLYFGDDILNVASIQLRSQVDHLRV